MPTSIHTPLKEGGQSLVWNTNMFDFKYVQNNLSFVLTDTIPLPHDHVPDLLRRERPQQHDGQQDARDDDDDDGDDADDEEGRRTRRGLRERFNNWRRGRRPRPDEEDPPPPYPGPPAGPSNQGIPAPDPAPAQNIQLGGTPTNFYIK